jgi:hypothetical protein
MNNDHSLLSDVLGVLSVEELLRVVYRLRRAGNHISAGSIELELRLRELAAKKELFEP